MSGVLDLEAYLARIGYAGGLSPDLPTLAALHEAHALAVPFENLAIQMGEGVRIDLASLQDKLVRRRRGGYCFEQNGLFLAVLRELGFEVDPFEARVRFGTDAVLPRTHMLLRVRLHEGDFLADVGFGGQGVRRPVPLDGTVSDQAPGEALRVAEEGGLRVLQSRQLSGWADLYAFEPVPRHAVDFEMGNWYTSTHPESRFVKTLTAQRMTPEGRLILRNLSLTEVRGDRAEERLLELPELPRTLREVFGLDIPDGARFRAFEASEA